MLFALTYVPNHGIYALHSDVLNFFAQSVARTRYNQNQLFSARLRNVVRQSRNLNLLFQNVFRQLNKNGINKQLVVDTLTHNNDIVQLLGDVGYALLRFPTPGYNDLDASIKELYGHLWLSTIKTISCVNNFGSIKDHYKAFDILNKPSTKRVCAFCGLRRLENPDERMNAYDHYLHQDEYPALSINFDNLVPMCSGCNERPNKGTKNVIVDGNTRRLAFYPYSPVLNFEIEIIGQDVGRFNTWTAAATCANPDERFATWKGVFNIDLRFTNHLKSYIDSWINNLHSFIIDHFPANSNELLASIAEYYQYRRNCDIDVGYFLELQFWLQIGHLPQPDIDILYEYLSQRTRVVNTA